MSGPTIYQQLVSGATEPAAEKIRDSLRGYLAAQERDLTQEFVAMLRHAYIEGVRDGFQQGLAAASSPAGSPGEETSQ